jgi:hypothetical protein
MPSKGTPLRNVRVSDDVWYSAKSAAEALGYESLSSFIQIALAKLAVHQAGTGIVVVKPPPRSRR